MEGKLSPMLLECCVTQGPYGPMAYPMKSPESLDGRVGNRRGPEWTLDLSRRQIIMDLVSTPAPPWRIRQCPSCST